MKYSFLALLLCLQFRVFGAEVVDFSSEDAKDPSNLRGLNFVSRFYFPYGPDIYTENPTQTASDRPYKGYGFGMGGAEVIAYDKVNHYMYAGSLPGYINVADFSDPTNPKITNIAIDNSDKGEVEDIQICPEQNRMFFAYKDLGKVLIYDTVQRDNPKEPKLISSVETSLPALMLINQNCTFMAVANQNSGEDLSQGSVTFIRNLNEDKPILTTVPIDNVEQGGWDDEYVLGKGIHMPLTKNSLQYWDEVSPKADELDFTLVRENYKSAIFLEPEAMAFTSPDETEILMNLQVNNGLVRVDIANNRASSLVGYGLIDNGEVPIDINKKDKTCSLKTYSKLFSMRNPDTITTMRYNGKLYVLTANEGAIKEYGDFEDAIKAKDFFAGNETGLPQMQVSEFVFDRDNISAGPSALFNAACEGPDCVEGVVMSLGSSAINYEVNATHPIFHRMVLYGGRGWSIFELPENPDALLKLVFDSGDDGERFSCEKFPWAYNSEVDESYAPTDNLANNSLWHFADDELKEELLESNNPVDGGCEDQGDGTPGACPLKQTIDKQSEKEGPAFENIVTGVACGRLIAVTATEKNSMAWLYDITNLASPSVIKTFHLSPSIRDKSPGLAYNEGTLGEIDPESFFFLSAAESPSGKAAIVFDGAHSGTISWWEFDCVEPDNPNKVSFDTSSAEHSKSTYAIVFSVFLFIGFMV